MPVRRGTNPLVASGEDAWPESGPLWRRGLRRGYDSLTGLVGRVHLPGAIRALDVVGAAANLAGLHGPSAREVAALFPWLATADCRAVARHIAALRLKNRAAIALVDRGGIGRLATCVRWSSGDAWTTLFANPGGTVVLACHVGAFHGIRAAFHRIERPTLMIRDLHTEQQSSRAAALMQSIDYLRGGGVVVATLDGPGGTSTGEVVCLGRRVVMRRGAFVLARLTGAPLVPVVCAWTASGEIAIRIAAPIEPPTNGALDPIEIDTLMAQGAARWLDAYLRAEPQEIWLSTLRHYLSAPPAERGAG